MKNCYHILKIIETLCEKENNGPKGVVVEKNWFKNNCHLQRKINVTYRELVLFGKSHIEVTEKVPKTSSFKYHDVFGF